MATIFHIPNELLSMILRLATTDDESLRLTYDDPFVLSTYRFDEYARSLAAFKTKSSISRVCKHWNALSSPFLLEYIFCLQGPRVLSGLEECISREDTGIKGARGQWTKRVDLYLNSDADVDLELQKWRQILSLTPNAMIVDTLSAGIDMSIIPDGWSSVFFALSRLENLRRVEWHAKDCDLSDLQQLSILCPNLTHLSFSLSTRDDPDVSTDAFTISFPNIQVFILDWDQTDYPSTVFPPFQPWNFPQLRHFGYFLKGLSPFRIVMPLLRGWGNHLTSLELPTLGKNELVYFSEELLPSLPLLETLILDIFKVALSFIPSHRHTNLRTLGWRLRLGSALYDTQRLHHCRHYFNLDSFPNLERVRVVHPRDFWDYANNMTGALILFWNELISDEGWVPVVDFDGEPIVVPSWEGEEGYKDEE